MFGDDPNHRHHHHQCRQQLQPPLPCCVQYLKVELPKMIDDAVKRAVSEALGKQPPEALGSSSRLSSEHNAESSASASNLYLHFNWKIPSDGLYTTVEIQRQIGEIKVELRNTLGNIEHLGSPRFPIKIKIFALEDKGDDLTAQEFTESIAQPRKDKPALLKGNREFPINDGFAAVSGLAFTDNSSCRLNKNLRLGARATSGVPPGVVVKDAVSEPFRVKERRTMKNHRASIQAESSFGASCSYTEDDPGGAVPVTSPVVFGHRTVSETAQINQTSSNHQGPFLPLDSAVEGAVIDWDSIKLEDLQFPLLEANFESPAQDSKKSRFG